MQTFVTPVLPSLVSSSSQLQLPILYLVYLLAGVPDGGHVIPYGRMWEGEPDSAVRRGLLSSLVSISFASALLAAMGPTTFATVCLIPWSVMSMWLFMVTYLQHHSPDGKLYTDDTWSFVRGGFETVDRDYGWVNDWSHNMMDGHVMHHLFFTKVPHYRLKQGTDELAAWLKERDQVREGVRSEEEGRINFLTSTPPFVSPCFARLVPVGALQTGRHQRLCGDDVGDLERELVFRRREECREVAPRQNAGIINNNYQG